MITGEGEACSVGAEGAYVCTYMDTGGGGDGGLFFPIRCSKSRLFIFNGHRSMESNREIERFRLIFSMRLRSTDR